MEQVRQERMKKRWGEAKGEQQHLRNTVDQRQINPTKDEGNKGDEVFKMVNMEVQFLEVT